MLVGQDHSLAALAEIVVPLKTEKELSYTKEATADGILRNVGGASMTLHATTLSFDEAETLLDQFGLSLETPSAYITIAAPDLRREFRPYFGVATLNAETTDNGWWTNFLIELSGLVPAWTL